MNKRQRKKLNASTKNTGGPIWKKIRRMVQEKPFALPSLPLKTKHI